MDVATGMRAQDSLMALRYYDHIQGRGRLKPRYKWAVLAFTAGMIAGMVFGHIV
jgi:hypothetical protein